MRTCDVCGKVSGDTIVRTFSRTYCSMFCYFQFADRMRKMVDVELPDPEDMPTIMSRLDT